MGTRQPRSSTRTTTPSREWLRPLHCFFCGQPLLEASREGQLACRECQARFLLEGDPTGCVVAMRIQTCGTPDCCQLDKRKVRGLR